MSKTLLKFYADWCGPCRAMNPIVEKLAAKHGIEVRSINIEEEPLIAQAHSILSVPTFVLYEGGTQVALTTGAQPLAKLATSLGLTN